MSENKAVRVFWKPHEQQSVALRASEIYHNDRANHVTHPRTWRESLVTAQYEVLVNPARHKPAPSFKTWPKTELDKFFELGNRLRVEKERIEGPKDPSGSPLTVNVGGGGGIANGGADGGNGGGGFYGGGGGGGAAAPAPVQHPQQQHPHPLTPVNNNGLRTPAPEPASAPPYTPYYPKGGITGDGGTGGTGSPSESEQNDLTTEQIHHNTSRKVSALIKLMVRHTVASFEQQLDRALTEAMDKAFEQVHERVTTRVSHLAGNARVRKPTVAIIGLLSKFYGDINKEYDDFFNITFISRDNENKDLPARLKHKDYVIVNTDFTSHSITDTIRNHPGVILAPGNNAVKDKLLELAANI